MYQLSRPTTHNRRINVLIVLLPIEVPVHEIPLTLRSEFLDDKAGLAVVCQVFHGIDASTLPSCGCAASVQRVLHHAQLSAFSMALPTLQ